ncbi:MAG TPA: LuxR C-terminal-related transcriptional regulator [Anaerolineales bacterium]|nr:LuxR C-terminal-related transcriptional regulator [Anaerolineales bacterium]
MASSRKKKSLRPGLQTNKYFHTLDHSPRLINRIDPADGSRSTDHELFDLYDSWLALSQREQHVTYLACKGYKNTQIAFQMGVSVATVKSYLQHVFLKIGVRNKTELRLKFVKFDFARHIPPHI